MGDTRNESVVEAAAAEVERAGVRVERLEPRLRRFALALYDLGLSEVVGRGWAEIAEDDSAFTFGDLSPRAFDRLVCILEDARRGGRRPALRDLPGQRTLAIEVSGPVLAAERSSVHVQLPR